MPVWWSRKRSRLGRWGSEFANQPVHFPGVWPWICPSFLRAALSDRDHYWSKLLSWNKCPLAQPTAGSLLCSDLSSKVNHPSKKSSQSTLAKIALSHPRTFCPITLRCSFISLLLSKIILCIHLLVICLQIINCSNSMNSMKLRTSSVLFYP